MKKVDYKVTDPKGMHARPAGIISSTAKQFASVIRVACGSEEADMKKLLPLMGLTVRQNDVLHITIEGADEAEAAAAVEASLKECF
ncbi:MAG: HPr family phosphocarrier protein [Lachnospiraceae bacterium]|nr:HPr family phosphocarrier protein [Lachnospiraceae bacterium]